MINTQTRAALVANFSKQVTSSINWQFDALLKQFGPSFKGAANSRSYHVWRETVRPCCDASSNRMDAVYTLSADRVARKAAELAEQFADEVIAKLNIKLGELTNGSVAYVSGANFLIHGTKNGQSVAIEQNQIINVSVKGKLFNQFPARIYVDKKFTSAAKFKKMSEVAA